MKHCIIVKFKKDVNYKSLIPEIKELFNNCKEIVGIDDVLIYENVIDRSNRYNLMIQIIMNKDALNTYDECIYHKMWKEKYGSLIESKAIFDMEDAY